MSLARLKPRYIPLGLTEGFTCPEPEAGKYFSGLVKDKNKGLALASSREILGREVADLWLQESVCPKKGSGPSFRFLRTCGWRLPRTPSTRDLSEFCQMGKIEEEDSAEEAITLEFDDGITLHLPIKSPIYFPVMSD